MSRDWRLPENRREHFQRLYSFHLKYGTNPGCVYHLMPSVAAALDMDEDQRAWLVWLNGNTQNMVTSLLLFEAAPTHKDWAKAVAFWDENFTKLEWDTDRRHQKSKFGVATEQWFWEYGHQPAKAWLQHSEWADAWRFSKGQPYMGRLSAWSMLEYARILLGPQVPDADTLLLDDLDGSRSHRNGLGLVAGFESTYWEPGDVELLGVTQNLQELGSSLLAEAHERNPGHPDVGYLTLESALCTYKSHFKPNRRYPNVYADMMYQRIKKGEARFGHQFDLLWESRKHNIPSYLRLEDNPRDPGLTPVKQNWFLEHGEVPMMSWDYPDMRNGFDDKLRNDTFPLRKDPTWT